MEIKNQLIESGLPTNESKVYLELLKLGSVSANDLAKRLSLDRTLVYQVLNRLIEKGLANYINKENKRFYAPSNPKNLLNPIKEKESIVLNLIPKLEAIEKVKEVEQEIRVYEGKNGLKVLMDGLLQTKDILILGATGKTYDCLKYELPHLIKKAEDSGIRGKMILSSQYKKHPMTKIKGIKVKFMEELDSPSTTIIYKDKISIHLITEKAMVITIKNKEIADSHRSYFNLLWKSAK